MEGKVNVMSSRKERMYKDSPKLERGESGEMGVKKPNKAQVVEAGVDGAQREGEGASETLPSHVRHQMERDQMYARHSHEHALHDHHESGDKAEMHERHAKEMKSIYGRHEKEMKAGSMSGEKSKPVKESSSEKTGEKEIEKIKSDKKE